MIITEIKTNLHVLSKSTCILMLTREPETHYLLVHIFFSLINAQYGTQCQIYTFVCILNIFMNDLEDKLSM